MDVAGRTGLEAGRGRPTGPARAGGHIAIDRHAGCGAEPALHRAAAVTYPRHRAICRLAGEERASVGEFAIRAADAPSPLIRSVPGRGAPSRTAWPARTGPPSRTKSPA